MTALRRALGLAAAAVCLVAALGPQASAGFPGSNGRIYFSARVDGASNDNEILSIAPDGTGLTNVTPPFAHVPFEFDGDNWGPALTGDGSRFVWLTDRCWDTQPTPYCGSHQIGIANADGSGAQRVTDLTTSNQETATVSPDGTKIAFASDRSTGCCEIWIQDLVTGSLTQVTHTGQLDTASPAFSPDGGRLAYSSNGHVWILDLATGITVESASGGQPTWSPDGDQIAFASGRTGASEIWRSNLDGSGAVQLTFLGCNESNPSWSPDGTLIVFHDNCDDGLDIVNAVDGSGRRTLIGDHTPYPSVGAAELPNWQVAPAVVQPPTVVGTTPASGATGVSSGAVVSATFSRGMDPATITTASFTLAGPSGAVAASVAYDGTSDTATLTPSAPLAAGTTYTATLAATIAAADGATLSGPVSWTFTTAAATAPGPPTVVALSPADGTTNVNPFAAVTATFSRAMDASTIGATSFTLAGPAGGVGATVSYDGATNTASLAVAGGLAYATTYTATLASTITAADGVPLAAAVTWSFTTGPSPLQLLSSVPKNSSDDVPVDTAVTVTFNKPLDPSTVDSSSVHFETDSGTPVASTISYVPGSTTLTLTPEQPLAYSTLYALIFGDSLRAADGAALLDPKFASVFFRTAAPPPPPPPLELVSSVPKDFAENVPVDTSITATFDKPLDPSTIDSSSVKLELNSGAPVAATVSYTPGSTTLTLTPDQPLAYSTEYAALFQNGLAAADGGGLPDSKGFAVFFRTAPPPPAVSFESPPPGATDVPVAAQIEVDFTEAIDPATLTTASFTLSTAAGPVAAQVGNNTKHWALTPAEPLLHGTTYTVTLSTAVTSANGVPLAAPVSWSFTTTTDTTPPVISPVITGTLGDNDWYTSDVSLHWVVTEPETPATLTTSGCADASITADEADDLEVCLAFSAGGDSSASVRIKRDATPPTVVLGPHPLLYTVDQMVSIGCSATDAMSGIAQNCTSISAPAYTFRLGPNFVSAHARDNAGNMGSAVATFDVLVTADSLCRLTEQFVAGATVTRAGHASAALTAAACSSLTPATGPITRTYDAHIADLVRLHYLTPAQAAVLERLAAALA